MIDFLKANPFVTREEYEWQWTIPQIKLATYDYTHIEYSNNKSKKSGNTEATKEQKGKVIGSSEDMVKAFGSTTYNF